MKALILAAGAGKRFKQLTRQKNKCMFSISGRPLIEHSLDIAASLDEIGEIIIVVGHMAESIINQYGTRYRGKAIRYRIQSPVKGVVAAMASAKPDIDGHDFLQLFGSEIIPGGRYQEMMADFYETRPYVSCYVFPGRKPGEPLGFFHHTWDKIRKNARIPGIHCGPNQAVPDVPKGDHSKPDRLLVTYMT